MNNELKARAREIIQQLDALYNSKRPGGGVHGQVIGMEPWTIRTTGDGLQCVYEAQYLLHELLDPFDHKDAPPSPQPVAESSGLSACACCGAPEGEWVVRPKDVLQPVAGLTDADIEWGHDLQARLMTASQDISENEDARQVMAEAACLLAALTGNAGASTESAK